MLISIKIAKLDTVIELDTDSIPDSSKAYLLTYGATQSYNDAAAGVVRKNFGTDEAYHEAVDAKVGKRHDQVLSGNVPGSRAPADPNVAKARHLTKMCATAGVDIAAVDPEKLVKWLARQVEAGRAA